VYEVTRPKTHNTNKTIATVYSMSVLLFLIVIERHPPALCLDATARCIYDIAMADGLQRRITHRVGRIITPKAAECMGDIFEYDDR
jgi:hypothetical protein